MGSDEIRQQIDLMRSPDHRFIKWWQREHDYLNFELLDHFDETLRNEGGINWLEGFELLDTEQMWEELRRRFPGRVRREKKAGSEVLIWNRPKKEEQVCVFTPENMMTILDVETRGRVVDG